MNQADLVSGNCTGEKVRGMEIKIFQLEINQKKAYKIFIKCYLRERDQTLKFALFKQMEKINCKPTYLELLE